MALLDVRPSELCSTRKTLRKQAWIRCAGRTKYERMPLGFMLTSSCTRLFASCENARNSCLILTLACIVAACAGSSVSSAQPVELQEVLSIDGFFDISDIAVGRDGSIYIADHQSFALSKYDPQGRLIRQVGSQGVAPSEFVNAPHSIALIDSILIATDQKGIGAMHYFNLDLDYIGSDQIETPVDMDVAPNGQTYFGNFDLNREL